MLPITRIKKFIYKQISDIKKYGIKELIKKFFLFTKILIKLPIYIIATIPCLIIRLISPFFLIRIESIPCTNFGDFVYFVSIYYCQKQLKINQPKQTCFDLFYFYHKHKNYNKQLEKMWRRKLIFLSSYLLDPINKVNRIFPGWEKFTIEIISTKLQWDVDNLFEKYQALNFTDEEEVLGKKNLKKFGLSDNDKFVCLAVRDAAYGKIKDPTGRLDFSYNDFRNSDISNFKLACEELAKKGYYIFRMGVVAEKTFNSNNPKIIDYVNSELKSDFMDIYLGAKCTFCISTGLGFDNLPYVFGRPIALANVPLADTRTHSKKFLLLTKHHFLRKEKRKLSISEIFSHGLSFAFDSKIYERKGVELIDYTPEEIRDFVLEMHDKLEHNKKMSNEDENLQKTFQKLFNSNYKSFHDEITKNTRWHKLHNEVKAQFSTNFLRNNKSWLR